MYVKLFRPFTIKFNSVYMFKQIDMPCHLANVKEFVCCSNLDNLKVLIIV